MLRPLYSHYKLLHVSASRGDPQGVLIHFVTRANKIPVQCKYKITEQRVV